MKHSSSLGLNEMDGTLNRLARGFIWNPQSSSISGLLLGAMLMGLASLTFAQPPSVNPVVPALNQMAATAGWTKEKIPNDLLAFGTLTQDPDGKPAKTDFVIKQKGINLSRIEISGGDLVTLTNSDQAANIYRIGTEVLQFYAAISMRPYYFPFYSDLTAVTDPNVAFSSLGPQSVNGQSAQRIDINRQPAAGDPHAAARQRVKHLTAWIADNTHLLAQIQFSRVSKVDPTAVTDHLVVFSDYRTVNGVMIPFHQEEYVGTQRIAVVQLNTVQVNVGLADANFVFLGLQQ